MCGCWSLPGSCVLLGLVSSGGETSPCSGCTEVAQIYVLVREEHGAWALMGSSTVQSQFKSLDEAGWVRGVPAMGCAHGVAM